MSTIIILIIASILLANYLQLSMMDENGRGRHKLAGPGQCRDGVAGPCRDGVAGPCRDGVAGPCRDGVVGPCRDGGGDYVAAIKKYVKWMTKCP